MRRAGALDGSPCWTAGSFSTYLASGAAPWASAFARDGHARDGHARDEPTPLQRGADAFTESAARLRAAAGDSAVYIFEDRAFLREALAEEFPELAAFGLAPEAAFVAAAVPGFFIPTRRFVALAALAPMRRAIRESGARPPGDAVALIRELLGI